LAQEQVKKDDVDSFTCVEFVHLQSYITYSYQYQIIPTYVSYQKKFTTIFMQLSRKCPENWIKEDER